MVIVADFSWNARSPTACSSISSTPPWPAGPARRREHLQHRQSQAPPPQGCRYGKNKRAAKNCHSVTMGLLITPSGMRIPFWKPYHTRDIARGRVSSIGPRPKRRPT